MSQKRKWNELSKQEQDAAKARYMEYQSVASIADDLGVPRTTIQYHAKTHWEAERELLKAELFSKFTSTKRTKFIEMSEASIKIITRSLQNLVERNEAPTTREARDATIILEALDKITRLDDGRPTEITEEKVMDMNEIQAIASLVPFKPKLAEPIEEVEFEEVNDEEASND